MADACFITEVYELPEVELEISRDQLYPLFSENKCGYSTFRVTSCCSYKV